jgi:hypothetical protein
MLGFICFNFKNKISKIPKNIIESKYLSILLFVVIISYLLRWFDLFYIRELSFTNEFKENRVLSDLNYNKSNVLLIIASIFKSLYFFPFVLISLLKPKPKQIILILSYISIVLPFVEALLKGTRKPFLEVFIIVFTVLFIIKKNKINTYKIGLTLIAFIMLMIVSISILFNRLNEKSNKDDFFTHLSEGRYNDMLTPTKPVKEYFNNPNKPKSAKYFLIAGLHTGQYFTHGLFEFNHIISNPKLPITYGSYTFATIPKLINKTGVFNKIKYHNPSPRKHVYLTAFGGLYIDFRWFSIVLMFLFGVFQKYIFQKSEQLVIWTPVLIYLLIINVFLLTINYLRGAGVYPIISAFLFFILIRTSGQELYEKSSNT